MAAVAQLETPMAKTTYLMKLFPRCGAQELTSSRRSCHVFFRYGSRALNVALRIAHRETPPTGRQQRPSLFWRSPPVAAPHYTALDQPCSVSIIQKSRLFNNIPVFPCLGLGQLHCGSAAAKPLVCEADLGICPRARCVTDAPSWLPS